MDKNIRIARQLLKIAKSLCAGYESPKYCNGYLNIKIVNVNVAADGTDEIDESEYQDIENSIKKKIPNEEFSVGFRFLFGRRNFGQVCSELSSYYNREGVQQNDLFTHNLSEHIISLMNSCFPTMNCEISDISLPDDISYGKKYTFYVRPYTRGGHWDMLNKKGITEILITLECEIDFNDETNSDTLHDLTGGDWEQYERDKEEEREYWKRYNEISDVDSYLYDDDDE